MASHLVAEALGLGRGFLIAGLVHLAPQMQAERRRCGTHHEADDKHQQRKTARCGDHFHASLLYVYTSPTGAVELSSIGAYRASMNTLRMILAALVVSLGACGGGTGSASHEVGAGSYQAGKAPDPKRVVSVGVVAPSGGNLRIVASVSGLVGDAFWRADVNATTPPHTGRIIEGKADASIPVAAGDSVEVSVFVIAHPNAAASWESAALNAWVE